MWSASFTFLHTYLSRWMTNDNACLGWNIVQGQDLVCKITIDKVWFRLMVFNATFSNISVISWRSVLLVEETGIPRENHRLVASHWWWEIKYEGLLLSWMYKKSVKWRKRCNIIHIHRTSNNVFTNGFTSHNVVSSTPHHVQGSNSQL
jgi:hypothetical protein